jgi:hypothetical protein
MNGRELFEPISVPAELLRAHPSRSSDSEAVSEWCI